MSGLQNYSRGLKSLFKDRQNSAKKGYNVVYMTDHAGPGGYEEYECNPVYQIVTRGFCNLVL